MRDDDTASMYCSRTSHSAKRSVVRMYRIKNTIFGRQCIFMHGQNDVVSLTKTISHAFVTYKSQSSNSGFGIGT